MCGIVGYVTNRPNVFHAEKKVYQELLAQLVIIDSLRGQDSTGFFGIDKKRNIYNYKQTVPGWDFLQHVPVEKILNNLDDMRAIAFHNRFATIGGAGNKAAAHPFNFPNIIGVHNGTLLNHRDLHDETWINDSETLFAAMNDEGPVEALNKAHGPIATAFYDKPKGTFVLYRNTERPLAIAKLKDDNTYFFASEKDMLLMVMNRSNVAVDWIEDLNANTMRVFDLEGREIKDYHVTTYSPPPKPVRNQTRGTGVIGPVTDKVVNLFNNSHQFNKKPQQKTLPHGFKVGDQHLMEITSLKMNKSGKTYHAVGSLLTTNYPKAIIHGIDKQDAERITPFLSKKEGLNTDTFLVYVKVMTAINMGVKEHEAIVVTPSKLIEEYSKRGVQDKIMEHFSTFSGEPVEDLTETPKPPFSPVLKKEKEGNVLPPDVIGDAVRAALSGEDTPATWGSKSGFDHDERWVVGPNHRIVTRAEFHRLVSSGCGVCNSPLEPEDLIDWDTYQTPCHKECINLHLTHEDS